MALTPEELKGLYVGQTLFRISKYKGNHNEKVSKIGNKYFYVGEGYKQSKHELSTGKEAADTNYPCVLWFDEHTYNEYLERNEAWMQLYQNFKYNGKIPEHLTTEKIKEITKMIFN